jgi:hypothetical protein
LRRLEEALSKSTEAAAAVTMLDAGLQAGCIPAEPT